ncbi:MAG: ribonuclease P protein component [Bacteroidales bacterium]|jgi:ribonuclease P protein component|nr:ribonuclease P protein component [Bacteroidales bacterium]
MSATKIHTFSKSERLCGKRIISELFCDGKSFFLNPYKIFWTKVSTIDDASFPVKFAVAVPKRKFKRAVARNLIKRRTREAFRTNKQLLSESIPEGKQIHLMVVYTSDQSLPYTELDASMKKIVQYIVRKNAESH